MNQLGYASDDVLWRHHNAIYHQPPNPVSPSRQASYGRIYASNDNPVGECFLPFRSSLKMSSKSSRDSLMTDRA